jgi:hypothetical protein
MTSRTAETKKTIQSITAEVQDKAKSAYARGSAVAGELGAIAKGNADAVVASGKLLGAGLKELGESSAANGRIVARTLLGDVKALGTVRSPADLIDLQVKLVQRNIDAALALSGKNSKALGKLASDVAAPLSSQVKANVTKLRSIA